VAQRAAAGATPLLDEGYVFSTEGLDGAAVVRPDRLTGFLTRLRDELGYGGITLPGLRQFVATQLAARRTWGESWPGSSHPQPAVQGRRLSWDNGPVYGTRFMGNAEFVPIREAHRRAGVSAQRLIAMAEAGEIVGGPPARPQVREVGKIYRIDPDSMWSFGAASLAKWTRLHRQATGSLGPVTLLSSDNQLEVTKDLASQIVGMPEDEAWSIVAAAQREWADTTGATAVTLDLRTRRVRVTIVDGLVRNAYGG
jgi:hypothetical protein